MKWPELTEGLANMLAALFVVGGIVFVLILAFRESGQARALRDRAEQAEARVSQLETADPLLPYTRTPYGEIVCVMPAEGYCGRYVLYRLTAAD